MTIGDDLFGDDLLGEDDLDMTPDTLVTRSVAIHFDGLTRDFPLEADGHYTSIHPVDSAMQMRLMVAAKGIKSSPTTGNGLKGNEHLDPRKVDSFARDQVRIATLDLVERGDVTIDMISVATTRGALMVEVNYFNERLHDRASKTLRVSL